LQYKQKELVVKHLQLVSQPCAQCLARRERVLAVIGVEFQPGFPAVFVKGLMERHR
jgi:hypothetical protein